MLNYLKIYENGTTVVTVNKPSYGEVSTTGDYFKDGAWYSSSGVKYTEQFTYASQDGKLLAVEVAGGQPVALHLEDTESNEVAPSLSLPAIHANDVVCNTLQLAETKWTNEDGIEYADEGLLGVPDTSFSSTGARIYPDGTIRGKSNYGEYVKYPDGRLEGFYTSRNVSFTVSGSYLVSISLPLPHNSITPTNNKVIGGAVLRNMFPSEYAGSPTTNYVRFYFATRDGSEPTAGDYVMSYSFTGTWK